MPNDMKDFEELLKEKGISPGKWIETGPRKVRPAFIDNQMNSLQSLKFVLEEKLQSLQESKAKALETLNRMKYGGGS